jgi:hypothetical protein
VLEWLVRLVVVDRGIGAVGGCSARRTLRGGLPSKGSGELGVAIANQKPELLGAVGEVHQQVAGLPVFFV